MYSSNNIARITDCSVACCASVYMSVHEQTLFQHQTLQCLTRMVRQTEDNTLLMSASIVAIVSTVKQ